MVDTVSQLAPAAWYQQNKKEDTEEEMVKI